MHPKKRKYIQYIQSRAQIRPKSNTNDKVVTISAADTEKKQIKTEITFQNSYQMYLKMKKEIQERQGSYVCIKRKLPKNPENYLMFNSKYGLDKDNIKKPTVKSPPNLPLKMFIEFIAQDLERYKLSVQHQIEKDKLVLVVEQELLRVHTRSELISKQSIPLSACTILQNKEIYTLLSDHKTVTKEPQNKRQPISRRILCSSLQDVKDKWEVVKQQMLNRHKLEAESLNAYQKMLWERKLKKCAICPHNKKPTIHLDHVPLIVVTDFDLPT